MTGTSKINSKYLSNDIDSRIIVVNKRDLEKNNIIKQVLYSLDEYIIQEKNILINNYYDEFMTLNSDISFALGAGCSIDANISDWNMLSEALGFDLLYNIVDDRNSIYKNMYITNELNKKIFASFEKTSALDVIYNSFINSTTTTKLDYFKIIKNVLYMSYDSPKDSKTNLITSIVKCINRRRVQEIISYNFDSILEQNYDSMYKSSANEILNSITMVNKCKVYHVHGYIPYDYDGKTIVNNFVFTDTDYYNNAINRSSNSNMIQKNIFSSYNVIFVGVSFTDSNIKEILRERALTNYKNSIFGFLKLPSFSAKGRELDIMINKYKLIQQSYFDTLGVKILWVKEFSEIPDWINKL